MSQVSNALKMYMLLQKNGKMKISEIASMLETDERTVRRYRDDLEFAGIYIDSERGKYGGYTLRNNNFLLGLNISSKEQYSLQLVERYLKDSQHIAAKDISSLVIKINAANSVENDTHVNLYNHMAKEIVSNTDPDFERKKFLDLHEAVLLRKKIRIDYTSLNSGRKTRIVHPYATLEYKNDLYFIGFCELKEEILDFKICRINNYELLNETFEKDESFSLEKCMENCIGIYKDKEYNIKLKVKYPMSQIVKEKIWVSNQVITDLDDKSIIFEAKMRGLTEIKTWILGMGANVTVLEPDEVAEEIKNEINKMKNLYMCNDMS
ncbi:helix-turn-helix transcriptional regulator [Acetivibrio mesophilus]|uniref:Transcriptional regulator n=1 Tax=Acetivibrio mesophilus TaxID=2487273 RepID=A0A4Q0I3T4_9FIRM|nr:transcriptional regulator [Acetivibrio mesophilus]ODM27291.1 transcriptional regulator [Clostridium sp. Bc-iso-3]RXE58871.1 transcriptional regulator [Acetivibrio mesophilus]HHV29533.1 transcriptional regulator [Clostridium sp.]